MPSACATRVAACPSWFTRRIASARKAASYLVRDRLLTGFSASMTGESYFLRVHSYPTTSLTDGRRFRTLHVRDDYNRQLLGVKVDCSLPASRVVQVLTRLVECYGRPTQLRTDNGPEFISTHLSDWCEKQGIDLHWIQPGKPTQDAYIERCNGSFRRELLDAHLFWSLAHARQLVDEWMLDYNTQRPHQALNFMTPIEFKQAA